MIAAIKSKIKYPTSNAPFGSAYEEHAAIKDTTAEVRALRKNGIHVSAVFMGNDGEVTNAKQIYGKEFTRIRQIATKSVLFCSPIFFKSALISSPPSNIISLKRIRERKPLMSF